MPGCNRRLSSTAADADGPTQAAGLPSGACLPALQVCRHTQHGGRGLLAGALPTVSDLLRACLLLLQSWLRHAAVVLFARPAAVLRLPP